MTEKVIRQVDRLTRLINIYLLKRGTEKKAWTHPGKVNESRCKSSDIMLGYYLDFSEGAEYKGPFDANGVPLLDYTGRIGIQYNPWFIGHYAFMQFEKFRATKCSDYKHRFLQQAQWFIRNFKERRSKGTIFAVWEYNFSWNELKAPFISSLSQSYGLSVLLRAYKLTGDEEYFSLAHKAFNSFLVDIDDGGVANFEDGKVLFEESPIRPADTVLNGFIFSIWGVLEYAQFTNLPLALELYHKSLNSLLSILPDYDMGFWSKYSRGKGLAFPPIASWFYHRVHIAQMKALFLITGNDTFEYYFRKWDNNFKSPSRRWLAFILKAGYKILNK